MLCTESGALDTSGCHSLQWVVFNTCTPAVVGTSLTPKAHGNFYKRPFYVQFHTGGWRFGCNQTLLYSEILTTSTTLKGECGLTVQHLCQLLCNHTYHNTRQFTALRVSHRLQKTMAHVLLMGSRSRVRIDYCLTALCISSPAEGTPI